MSEPTPVIPTLTVFSDGTEYTIRASGDQGKRLGVSFISRMGDYSKVTFITDTDIKIYKSSTTPKAPDIQPTPTRQPKPVIYADGAAPPQPEQVEEFEQELADQRKAEAEIAQMERLNRESIPRPEPVEIPPERKVRPAREKVESATITCGRCGGAGQLVGESGFGGACPVCRGEGKVTAYGRRRGAR